MTTPAVLPPSLTVAEIFGPTIQGEGPSMGRRCSFIRLGGCNLTCEWCDSKFTWDASMFDLRAEMQRMEIPEILERVLKGKPDRVVISGGEPLLQQRQEGWMLLLAQLVALGIAVEIETNGTQIPTEETLLYTARFNVSPKLAHGGDTEDKRIVPKALGAFAATYKAEFKFVCQDYKDVNDVAILALTHGIPENRVWIMPEGVHPEDLIGERLARIAHQAIENGFNVTTRLHILAWGNTRGN